MPDRPPAVPGRADAGQPDKALARAREAVALLDHQPPAADPEARAARAVAAREAATLLKRVDAPPGEMLMRAEAACRLTAELRRDYPDRPEYAFALFEALEQLGKVYVRAKQPAEATRVWTEAVNVLAEVLAKAPKGQEALWRQQLGGRYLRLGRHLMGEGQRAEAERWFLAQARLWPNDAGALREVARQLKSLADTAAGAKDETGRRRYLEQSERLRREADRAGR